MGILADINAISEDSAKLATDQATLDSLMGQVTAQQEAIASDQTNSGAADATLSADLLAAGPTFVVQPDGTAKFYQFSSEPPGYTITVAQAAT